MDLYCTDKRNNIACIRLEGIVLPRLGEPVIAVPARKPVYGKPEWFSTPFLSAWIIAEADTYIHNMNR